MGTQHLVERIRELERENAALRVTVARLERQVEELTRRLEEATRAQARQAAPFRRPKLVEAPKPPGRPKGHPPASRAVPQRLDRVLELPLDLGPRCPTPLRDKDRHVQDQTDWPPIGPIVTQFNIHSGYCPCGPKRSHGRHPEPISDAVGAAGNGLGPVALTMAAELKHRLGVPDRTIGDRFETDRDIAVCPATFGRAEQRRAELARPTDELLIDALRRCGVVHADETGWRMSRENPWLGVFSSSTVTIDAIRSRRGHEVPEAILGEPFEGILVIDGFPASDVLQSTKGQCRGHIVRRTSRLAETADPTDRYSLDELSELFREAIDRARRLGTMTDIGYGRRVMELENRLDAWLAFQGAQPGEELERLARHLAKHRWEWFVFLTEPMVPPPNNHAEPMLRPAVISRKVGGCTKTLKGALVQSILSRLAVSCRQPGRRFLDRAVRLFRGGEPQAIPLEVLPSG